MVSKPPENAISPIMSLIKVCELYFFVSMMRRTLKVRIANDEDQRVVLKPFDGRCAQIAQFLSIWTSCDGVRCKYWNNLTFAWEAKPGSPWRESAFVQGLDYRQLAMTDRHSCGRKTYPTSFGVFLPINKGNQSICRSRDTWPKNQFVQRTSSIIAVPL